MGWKSFKAEWLARRAGRRSVESDLARSARDVIGPTGWMWSGGWDAMAENARAYVGSFDRTLPPSIFVSERDRQRHKIPIPLVERMLEQYGEPEEPDKQLQEQDGS
jgi:hypothetical protein